MNVNFRMFKRGFLKLGLRSTIRECILKLHVVLVSDTGVLVVFILHILLLGMIAYFEVCMCSYIYVCDTSVKAAGKQG